MVPFKFMVTLMIDLAPSYKCRIKVFRPCKSPDGSIAWYECDPPKLMPCILEPVLSSMDHKLSTLTAQFYAGTIGGSFSPGTVNGSTHNIPAMTDMEKLALPDSPCTP